MEALSIIKRNSETRRFELNIEILESFFENNIEPDCGVSIISIAGALRKGKSFMLNFFIRYLRASVEEQENGEWINFNELFENGFHWRNGSTADTSGILIWPEVFYQTNNQGERTAIILMDTQGVFDRTCTIEENILIFAFSTMLTSLQIFNVSQLIQEDNLQYLQLFAEYGKLASETSNRKPFQKLLFLVRDWQDNENYPYGLTGGQQYLNVCLEDINDQVEELCELRRNIKSFFEDFGCFLMPHPGLRISNGFNGDLNLLEDIFVDTLKEFVRNVFSNNNLIIKKINGESLNVRDFINYITSFWTVFENTPTPQSILEVTIINACNCAKPYACEEYDRIMEDALSDVRSVSPRALEIIHVYSKQEAIGIFISRTRLGSDDCLKEPFREELNIYMNERFLIYKQINEGRLSEEANRRFRSRIINIASFVGAAASMGFLALRRFL